MVGTAPAAVDIPSHRAPPDLLPTAADRAVTPNPDGVFGPDGLDGLCAHIDTHGYATLRGAFDEEDLAAAENELVGAQEQLVAGALDARHGTAILDDPDATVDGRPFAHYVCFATEASPGGRRPGPRTLPWSR